MYGDPMIKPHAISATRSCEDIHKRLVSISAPVRTGHAVVLQPRTGQRVHSAARSGLPVRQLAGLGGAKRAPGEGLSGIAAGQRGSPWAGASSLNSLFRS